MVMYGRQSSAKRRAVDETLPGKSLMSTRKMRGFRTVPCGTPDATCAGEDVLPLSTTCCCRCARKLSIHPRVLPLIP
ncbi:hypothetical protein DPMN_170130 [Dreissena polymorpha]|uniref:Uncharacterized protein n=1 Tax=Dreissena polymorpha TaxID=45954 RepID=A0A9D4DXB0_DREPO|nr:hypothetical protein DPMN_170130 [Dreissena polymorpha]